jgi:hypothetical protein
MPLRTHLLSARPPPIYSILRDVKAFPSVSTLKEGLVQIMVDDRFTIPSASCDGIYIAVKYLVENIISPHVNR